MQLSGDLGKKYQSWKFKRYFFTLQVYLYKYPYGLGHMSQRLDAVSIKKFKQILEIIMCGTHAEDPIYYIYKCVTILTVSIFV